MCGRFTSKVTPQQVAEEFGVVEVPELLPRYNIAPTQPVAAIRAHGDSGRECVLLRWGLIPSWADDAKIGYKLINARAETAASKPAFRSAFKERRCLIVANGFYEWQKPQNRKGKKQPYYIHRKDDRPFAFAGLWERWHDADKKPIESCTILTTEANDLVRFVHDRMPVILPAEHYQRWLDPKLQKADDLMPLMQPFPDAELDAYAVSPHVNFVKNDDPTCMARLPAALF